MAGVLQYATKWLLQIYKGQLLAVFLSDLQTFAQEKEVKP